jgi:hypothetical protein
VYFKIQYRYSSSSTSSFKTLTALLLSNAPRHYRNRHTGSYSVDALRLSRPSAVSTPSTRQREETA